MCVSDDDIAESESGDEVNFDRSLVTGTRFSCNDIYLRCVSFLSYDLVI